MKLGIILLIAISGVLLASSLQQANSELLSNGKYILQGSGFATTEKSIYSAKVIGSSSIIKETPTQQEVPKEKTVQISILGGSSKPDNIRYYSVATVQITPGTTVIW